MKTNYRSVLRTLLLSMIFSASAARADTMHHITFGGAAADGAQVTHNGHAEQYGFALTNTSNGISAIVQAIPASSGFQGTFSYHESASGGLTLVDAAAEVNLLGYTYDLTLDSQGALTTIRAQDIWSVDMEQGGRVLSTNHTGGENIASLGPAVAGTVQSHNTRYLGIPLEGEATVSLLADAMTIRSHETFTSFDSLSTALQVLEHIALQFVWSGYYDNLACPPGLCGEGAFITSVYAVSRGVSEVGTTTSQVPEPMTAMLLGTGLLGLSRRRRSLRIKGAVC